MKNLPKISNGVRKKRKRKLIGFIAGEKGSIGKLQGLALGISGLLASGLIAKITEAGSGCWLPIWSGDWPCNWPSDWSSDWSGDWSGNWSGNWSGDWPSNWDQWAFWSNWPNDWY